MYCAVSSNQFFDNATAPKVGGYIALTADPASNGDALAACLPLIDIYCAVVWGISVSNTSLPFNITFNFTNFADGGVKQADCAALRTANGCTTATCLASKRTTLVNLFVTNRIPFIPGGASITSLGTFFNGTQNATAYTAVQQTIPTGGIEMNAGASTNANFVSIGMSSGQPSQTYSCIRLTLMSLAVWIFIGLNERF